MLFWATNLLCKRTFLNHKFSPVSCRRKNFLFQHKALHWNYFIFSPKAIFGRLIFSLNPKQWTRLINQIKVVTILETIGFVVSQKIALNFGKKVILTNLCKEGRRSKKFPWLRDEIKLTQRGKEVKTFVDLLSQRPFKILFIKIAPLNQLRHRPFELRPRAASIINN